MKGWSALALLAACLLSASRATALCCECSGTSGACAAAAQCSNSPLLFDFDTPSFETLCVGAGCGDDFLCTASESCGEEDFADCAPIGACKGVPAGGCVAVSEGLCVANGGTYVGDETRCPISDAPVVSPSLTVALTALLLAAGMLYLRRRQRVTPPLR